MRIEVSILTIKIEKSIEIVLGIWTRARGMVGADEMKPQNYVGCP